MNVGKIEELVADFIIKNGYQPKTVYLSPKQMFMLSSRFRPIDGGDENSKIECFYAPWGPIDLVESDEDNLPRLE